TRVLLFAFQVLVVPAFEMLHKHVPVPKNKQQLIQLLDKGILIPASFQYQVLSTSYAVHYPHSYSDVRSRSTLYECVLIANKLFQAGLKKKYKITSIPPYIKKS
ncbi:hypothetical protein LSH36_66g02058, partial [Paralvinella palmiformis]